MKLKKKIKLYILLYWHTFLSKFKKREQQDVFIYEDNNEMERDNNRQS